MSPSSEEQPANVAPEFKFVGFWLDEVAFRSLSEVGGDPAIASGTQPIQFQTWVGLNDEHKLGQVSLRMSVGPTSNKPYEITVRATGRFQAASDIVTMEHLDLFCRKNAPAILFPYIREVVHRLTADGQHGLLRINPVNLQAIMSDWRDANDPSTVPSPQPEQ